MGLDRALSSVVEHFLHTEGARGSSPLARTIFRDAGKVAKELGNSAGILLRHYHELMYRETAEKFWGLRPTRRMWKKVSAPG